MFSYKKKAQHFHAAPSFSLVTVYRFKTLSPLSRKGESLFWFWFSLSFSKR